MSEDHILIENPEAHPGVRVIRMNRPDKKNALTRAMYDRMADALIDADKDSNVRVVVMFGVPGCFSSGNDLNDFMAIAMEPSQAKGVNRFILELGKFAKPLLSGVDGLAIGIGTTMNLHCDLTFATPRSQFRTPFTDLALVPEAASSLLGPASMGHQRAFAMFAAGIGFTAEEARDAGLIWKVVSEDELEAVTLKAADDLAAKPPNALAISRKLLKKPVDDINARMHDELHHFANQLKSPEAMQAFQAFMNRKK
ncbi:crotonase/enoyl-CoA hydratase family protein [Rhizobium sp. L1K21]|uniref:crotonase/enoyl-CoA hydratase family protein n=1 Tax=Rhizobium sp. L1K21 TaxID=2954933 RepID=UPI002092F460|nr:crotonase/enoyl-CoA hydratase family protein [Rhizobium sp. L1K21]MCO6186890.1 crotonase/enoyl-CoA hydratase family protein [Rhizobium sp. L1K21]